MVIFMQECKKLLGYHVFLTRVHTSGDSCLDSGRHCMVSYSLRDLGVKN